MSAELSQSRLSAVPSALRAAASADIDEAARRIADFVSVSPLQHSDRLSAATGAEVYLKREDLQTVRSYKLRGAYNLLKQLSDEELRARGGVRLGRKPRAGIRPSLQVDGRARPGVRAGQDAQAEARPDPLPRRRFHRADRRRRDLRRLAAAAALEDVARTGATLVPPYDDPRTMSGQGTIAVEILGQLGTEPDLVVVPVGGGGCIAGITTYLAARTTNTRCWASSPQARPR